MKIVIDLKALSIKQLVKLSDAVLAEVAKQAGQANDPELAGRAGISVGDVQSLLDLRKHRKKSGPLRKM